MRTEYITINCKYCGEKITFAYDVKHITLCKDDVFCRDHCENMYLNIISSLKVRKVEEPIGSRFDILDL